ncbi:hypothetical protein PWT90_10665 [Aphanocladium album]|nr:hypothetical protein PWT90_10665 [Aphanocladium album]
MHRAPPTIDFKPHRVTQADMPHIIFTPSAAAIIMPPLVHTTLPVIQPASSGRSMSIVPATSLAKPDLRPLMPSQTVLSKASAGTVSTYCCLTSQKRLPDVRVHARVDAVDDGDPRGQSKPARSTP